MVPYKFSAPTQLPASPTANTLYFVLNGNVVEHYVTDAQGNPKGVGNTAVIRSVAEAVVSEAQTRQSLVEPVADIAARDALELTSNRFVLVEDASSDPTVDSGAALYIYKAADDVFEKIVEYEGLDVQQLWGNIQGRPASAPNLIDDAVTKRHAHTNKGVLDKLGEASDGTLRYGGNPVGDNNVWEVKDW